MKYLCLILSLIYGISTNVVFGNTNVQKRVKIKPIQTLQVTVPKITQGYSAKAISYKTIKNYNYNYNFYTNTIKNYKANTIFYTKNLQPSNFLYVDNSFLTDSLQIYLDILNNENISDDYLQSALKNSINNYNNDLKRLSINDYNKWVKVLNDNKKCTIEKIENKKIYKIIAEAFIKNNKYDEAEKTTLINNLTFLKQRKYDTVLVRFSCTDDLSLLIKMINDIKSFGFRVYTVYVGLDTKRPYWNPFEANPETIELYIKDIAKLSDGWLLNWRSISSHMKMLPIEYYNFICNTVRKYNDKCLIYGEIYFGKVAAFHGQIISVKNIPENVTGVLVNNIGYIGYNQPYIINKLFVKDVENYRQLDKIGQVIGLQPYYCSKNNITNLTTEIEYNYKKEVENSFNSVRCGTITLLHDGLEDLYTTKYKTCDNLIYDTKLTK